MFHATKHVIQSDTIVVTVFCNRKIIIDDILFYSNYISIFLHYFSFAAQVFTKYRLSFKVSKDYSVLPQLTLLAMS